MLAALAALAPAGRAGDAARSAAGAAARGGSAVGVAALTLLALVQHVDVIVAQHRLDAAAASAYAAAAVASKVVAWVAVGLALALLPELSRHARRGPEDARRLARTLALVAAVASPFTLALRRRRRAAPARGVRPRARRRGRRAPVAGGSR